MRAVSRLSAALLLDEAFMSGLVVGQLDCFDYKPGYLRSECRIGLSKDGNFVDEIAIFEAATGTLISPDRANCIPQSNGIGVTYILESEHNERVRLPTSPRFE